MGVLLGLAASVSYGVADFLGGITARRVGPFVVVLVSQAAGLAILLLALPFLLGEGFGAESAAWSAASGLVGAAGISLLYRGLAVGRMGVVAPTSAVLGAVVPVLYGVATGERPGSLQLAGVGIALVAVALVSASQDAESRASGRKGLAEAIGAGVAFGIFFLTFNEAGDTAGGALPIVVARATSVTVFAVIALARRRPLRIDRAAWVPLVATGALDMLANLAFLAGSRTGLLPIVAVLTSLYPASTVLLARLVLRERMTAPQVAGVAGALAGIVLITAG